MNKNISLLGTVTLLHVISLLSSVPITSSLAGPNPAALYCVALGYEYESGLCKLPNDEAVDAWEFLAGTVGVEWNYCSQKGYETKHVEDADICAYCSVCVLPDGKEVEVIELMGLLLNTTCGDGLCRLPENAERCPDDCPSGEWDDYCDGVGDDVCDPDCQVFGGTDPDCESIQVCGDGTCAADENYADCLADCPSGEQDGYCDGVSDGTCDPDCPQEQDDDCQSQARVTPLLIAACIVGAVIAIVIVVGLVVVRRRAR